MRVAILAIMAMKKMLITQKIATATVRNADAMINRVTIAIATVIAKIAHVKNQTILAANKKRFFYEY